MGEGLCISVRSAGRSQHGMRSEIKEICLGRLSRKFKLWIAAEVVLFVLVGAAVDIRYTATAGAAAIVMILLALVFRAVGVLVCMAGTALDKKERVFTVIAYLPKATVQAAIGSVPMAIGLACRVRSCCQCFGPCNPDHGTAWGDRDGYDV